MNVTLNDKIPSTIGILSSSELIKNPFKIEIIENRKDILIKKDSNGILIISIIVTFFADSYLFSPNQ